MSNTITATITTTSYNVVIAKESNSSVNVERVNILDTKECTPKEVLQRVNDELHFLNSQSDENCVYLFKDSAIITSEKRVMSINVFLSNAYEIKNTPENRRNKITRTITTYFRNFLGVKENGETENIEFYFENKISEKKQVEIVKEKYGNSFISVFPMPKTLEIERLYAMDKETFIALSDTE